MNNATRAIRWLAKAAALASSLGLLGSYVYVRAGGTLWHNSAASSSAGPASPAYDQDLFVTSTKSAPVFLPGQQWVVQEENEELSGPINSPRQPPRQPPMAAVPSHAAAVQQAPLSQQSRVLLPGSKSMPIDFTTNQPPVPAVIKNPFVPPVREQRVIPYQSLVPNQMAPVPVRATTDVRQQPAVQQSPAKKSLANPRQPSTAMQQPRSQSMPQQTSQQFQQLPSQR